MLPQPSHQCPPHWRPLLVSPGSVSENFWIAGNPNLSQVAEVKSNGIYGESAYRNGKLNSVTIHEP
ncbi:hypothetical protein [Mucilaginibacter sp.]|uniref:hypothetical protein n=1 Tax=Mucilaginibacter sp. TaxID=1882438 RepID=UPI00261E6A37|nr:hypothetical protein [Mucilaginibacter sp.]